MTEPRLPASITREPIPEGSFDSFIDRALVLAADTGVSPAEAAAAVETYVDSDEALRDDVRTALDVARFRVETIGHAEWAMRRLAEAEARLDEINRQANEWVAEIEAWAAREAARPEATAAYFRGLLEEYGRAVRADDPKAATVRLPSGSIESTARKPAPKIVDPDALVAWAQTNRPDVVETTTTYKVPAAVAKTLGHVVEFAGGADPEVDGVTRLFVTDDGEAIPGIEVEGPRLDVRVKPATVAPRR